VHLFLGAPIRVAHRRGSLEGTSHASQTVDAYLSVNADAQGSVSQRGNLRACAGYWERWLPR
jgi:hypothetical protein